MLAFHGNRVATSLGYVAVGFVSAVAAHGCNLTQSFDGLTDGPGPGRDDGGYDAVADAATPTSNGAADASTYAAVVLEDAPLGYWRLDELTGTVLHDSSGHGHDAELRGQGALGALGALAGGDGAAIALSGGELDVGSDDAFAFPARAPFTIEAWISPFVIDASYRDIARRATMSASGEPETGYQLFSHETKPLGIARYERGACGCATLPSTFPLARGQFSHVVATYDGELPRLYVDATLAPSAGGPSGWTTSPVKAPLVWGSKFDGSLDELAIYAVALPHERIVAHYRAAGR